jgi:hypothetical protein
MPKLIRLSLLPSTALFAALAAALGALRLAFAFF